MLFLRLFLFLAFATLFMAAGAHQSGDEFVSLISRIDAPRSGDLEKLASYGERAFAAVLPMAQARQTKHNAKPSDEGLADKLRNILIALTSVATERHTPEMTALYRRAIDEWSRATLMEWLVDKGTLEPNRAIFESAMRRSGSPAAGAKAVLGLVRLGDESAVQLLVSVLKDGSYAEDVRRAVYSHIAATGAPAALEAVRTFLNHSRTVPALEARADLAKTLANDPTAIRATTERDGVTYAIATFNGLGNPFDLWLFKKAGDAWVSPVFTGVSAYWPHSQTGRPTEGQEEHEAKIQQLTTTRDWIQSFVGNAELSRDTDGDGYTDIVERWLGLDPHKADMDGDGLPDGIDKNPLAAPRQLNDTEGALLAAFDAEIACRRFVGNLFVTFPASVRPFEITEWPGLVLPDMPTSKDQSHALFGIGFTLGATKGPAVKFGSDGSSAEVEVNESGGYYERSDVVRVKKIGRVWYPVDIRWKNYAIS